MFARSDWEYVFNTFAFGYAIGYHFIASKEGSCNGNFLGIGKDIVFISIYIHLLPLKTAVVCSLHIEEYFKYSIVYEI